MKGNRFNSDAINDESMISVADAIQIVREQTRKLPAEPVLLERARGRFWPRTVADPDLSLRSFVDGWLRGASQ